MEKNKSVQKQENKSSRTVFSKESAKLIDFRHDVWKTK